MSINIILGKLGLIICLMNLGFKTSQDIFFNHLNYINSVECLCTSVARAASSSSSASTWDPNPEFILKFNLTH